MKPSRIFSGADGQGRGSWRPLVLGTAVAGLVLASGVGAATDPAPANRAQALAMIQQAEAKAQAEMLEALKKEQTPLEKEWGVKLLGVTRTAGGYMLQFKYKILEPERARGMVQRKHSPNPYVVVEKSGAKLAVPFTAKLGSLRSSVRTASQIQKGKNYFTLFANPGKHVDSGDKVTIVMGDFKLEHVTVQ